MSHSLPNVNGGYAHIRKLKIKSGVKWFDFGFVPNKTKHSHQNPKIADCLRAPFVKQTNKQTIDLFSR